MIRGALPGKRGRDRKRKGGGRSHARGHSPYEKQVNASRTLQPQSHMMLALGRRWSGVAFVVVVLAIVIPVNLVVRFGGNGGHF